MEILYLIKIQILVKSIIQVYLLEMIKKCMLEDMTLKLE